MGNFFYKTRNYFIAVWLLAVLAALYLYFFKANFFQSSLQNLFLYSVFWGYAFYLILGCVRGFTLIPSTNLIVLGLLFFSPLPLFILTLAGVLVSSALVYYFSEFLRLDEFFKRRYQKQIARVKTILQKNELPIIIGWSFFPFLPTDIICYMCGTLKVDFKKFLLGIFIGEGAACGLYIFGGHYLLQFLRGAL